MDIEIVTGLIAAAEVAADHYRDEAEYFAREGEAETEASFAALERQVRDLIAKAKQPAEPNADPLVARIEELLDDDPTGHVRDALWDLVENTGDSPF